MRDVFGSVALTLLLIVIIIASMGSFGLFQDHAYTNKLAAIFCAGAGLIVVIIIIIFSYIKK